MSFTVRRAIEQDIPALGRLGAALMRLHYTFDVHRFLAPGAQPEQGYGWFLRTQLDEPDAVVLVAESAEQVLGYIYAGLEPLSWKELRGPAGFIHDLMVEEHARGGGVASALIAAALAWLKERGAPRVVLWTAEQNDPAQHLFAARGFRRTMIEMTREL